MLETFASQIAVALHELITTGMLGHQNLTKVNYLTFSVICLHRYFSIDSLVIDNMPTNIMPASWDYSSCNRTFCHWPAWTENFNYSLRPRRLFRRNKNWFGRGLCLTFSDFHWYLPNSWDRSKRLMYLVHGQKMLLHKYCFSEIGTIFVNTLSVSIVRYQCE